MSDLTHLAKMIDKQKSFDIDDEAESEFGHEVEQVLAFADSRLSEVFDRYALALDAGDMEAADCILLEYPEVGEEFRVPFRGLYLLERAARQQKFESRQADSVEPARLGDFEIGCELGRGGMGIVYEAQQISLRRKVALKILPFTAVLDPRQVARFRNEAQAAASLHHPNIVPVYGVGCERGVHYYSMQLIEGQTMAEFVEQFRRTDQENKQAARGAETVENRSTVVSINTKHYVQRMMEIGVRVAEAIHFAHENGIVPRDIKPSNLLLDQSGKIWVADFGLARGCGTPNLTSQGELPGTLRYMSPEQAAGRNNQVDFRTDIYSLGVTLYELLTLRPAFDATDRMQLLAAIDRTEPASLRSINSAIPVDLETLIDKAIAKEPAARYSSAQEFADDLARCLEGKSILAKRKTALDRCMNSVAKHRWLVAGVGAALLVTALVAVVIASVFYNQRQREHASAEQARFYLQQAHKSVDRFGIKLSDQLSGIPGTDPLRAKLLTEAIGYYDDFLKLAGDALELKFERAMAVSQLAMLYARAGDDSSALQSFDSAVAQLAELSEYPEAAIEQAVCYDRLGLLQKRQGDFPAAENSLNKALALFDSFDALIRNRTDVLVASAQTRANLGSLFQAKGRLPRATGQFEQALSLLASRVKDFPTLDSYLEDAELWSAYFKINGNHVAVLKEIDLARAEQTLRLAMHALELANSVLRKHGESTGDSSSTHSGKTRDFEIAELAKENSEHFADMQNNLAVILCHKGLLPEAEELVGNAIAYWRDRLVQAPLELNSADRLATALNTLGEIQWRNQESGLGDESFAEAEKLLLSVAGQFPGRPETLSRLGGVLHNRSLVAHQHQRDAEACETIARAIEFQTRAVELVPENTGYENLLKTHRQAKDAFAAAAPAAVPDVKSNGSNLTNPTSFDRLLN